MISINGRELKGLSVKNLYQKYKDHKAKAPERREAELAELYQRVAIAKEEVKLFKLRKQARRTGRLGRYFEGVVEAAREQPTFSTKLGLVDIGSGIKPTLLEGRKKPKKRKVKRKTKRTKAKKKRGK